MHNKISKFVTFEGDILETGKDMGPQSREILQTFVWGGGGKFVEASIKILLWKRIHFRRLHLSSTPKRSESRMFWCIVTRPYNMKMLQKIFTFESVFGEIHSCKSVFHALVVGGAKAEKVKLFS